MNDNRLENERDAVVYTIFRGRGRGVPGAMGGVLFYIGEIKNFAFFQPLKFSNKV